MLTLPRGAQTDRDRRYLVIYEDWYGDPMCTIMVTALPVEVAFKLLSIDKVLACEEVDE